MPHYPVIAMFMENGGRCLYCYFLILKHLKNIWNVDEQENNKFINHVYEVVKNDRIIIYGTGAYTYRLLANCKNLKNNVVGFSDSNHKKHTNNFLFELPCKEINKFNKSEYDSILISSHASQKEIFDYLINVTDKPVLKLN